MSEATENRSGALHGVFPFASVHKHQELALRNVKAGKHTVVAIGTGSGNRMSNYPRKRPLTTAIGVGKAQSERHWS